MMIYGAVYPAPNPRRVRMYLAEKGISPPYADLDIQKREHKGPDLVAKNSLGQVPTLVLDDGSAITESVAICRYFEALHPDPPLFGSTPEEKARVDMWIRRIEMQVSHPVSLFWVNADPRTSGGREQKYKEFGQAQAKRAAERMIWLNGEINDREFIAGDKFTMADIIAESTMDFAKFVGIHIPPEATALAAWRARIRQRPSSRA